MQSQAKLSTTRPRIVWRFGMWMVHGTGPCDEKLWREALAWTKEQWFKSRA